MIDLRQQAFNNISRVLAITRFDIEQRQHINDYGLNIHAENYFRDVFRFVYGYNFENANFESQNIACIDLIDRNEKIAYQITTTRTKEKIEKTFKALTKPEYKEYTLKIFFLLDKSKPDKKTIDELNSLYSIDLENLLLDYTDLIRDINNLETTKLIELNTKYFQGIENKYTEEMILNLVFKHLVQNHTKMNFNYDDDFVSIDTKVKLELNNINDRFSSKINNGLDYREILNSIEDEENVLSKLQSFVIEVLYRKVLIDLLFSKISKNELENLTITELHHLSKEYALDFNKIIHNLHMELKKHIIIDDFNATEISWIIIAFFFEICDVGIKE
ncbi:MAG: SMEK domain-containing protein [Sulfuricurvum sp.]|uniref:SMEK domain-containing protein n=1 Tax=Sulfuricurvum sp. TaxID=2025608 RepID=UPI0025D810B6|nr:SMEK domain-containing protein [Sulfuricurvum sp.]MCK9373768.1 SMEK domain-containing protein [Sulfuricurvum sp.]